MRDFDIRLGLGRVRDALADAANRLYGYVDSSAHRADVLQTLPASAPRGYLIVVPGDPNLYVGTGPGTPLRKLPTQLL